VGYDRWFTFPKFEETAKRSRHHATRRPARRRDRVAPADGVTQGGYWTMLSHGTSNSARWNRRPAVPADQRVLADYQKVDVHCLWSGDRPEELSHR